MNSEHHAAIQAFMDRVAERNPNEPEFLQAVEEVAEAIVPFMEDNPKYCLLYTSPSPRDISGSRMPSSA